MMETLGQCPNWQTIFLKKLPAIKANEVHIWWLPLTLNPAQSEKALELLSDIQRHKYHRRSNQELKDTYLAGRYYLLHLLGAYSNQQAKEIKLSYSRLNKPRLSNPKFKIDFNFTDTHGSDHAVGVFVFSKGRSIGVDIESRDRDINVQRIVEKRFSEQERTFVEPDGKLNRERALSIWTRKEAYGKATGNGINFKMNAENLVYNGENSNQNDTNNSIFSFPFNDSLNQAWRCEQFQLGDEFLACVVHEGHQKLVFKTFNSLTI